MSPDPKFQSSILDHLDRMKMREDKFHQNRNWTIEIFRQASLNSIQATHFRDAFLAFERIASDVREIVKEIDGIFPVLIWIWDTIKNSKELLSHLKFLEDKVRLLHHHHDRHGKFFEKYEANREQGLKIFQDAIRNVVAIFEQGDSWLEDPNGALRRIHEAQDGVAMTGLFLELVHESVAAEKSLDEVHEKKLALAIQHIHALGEKLHFKEERMHKLLELGHSAQP